MDDLRAAIKHFMDYLFKIKEFLQNVSFKLTRYNFENYANFLMHPLLIKLRSY